MASCCGRQPERYAAFGAAVEARWAERSVQPARGSRAQGLTFRRRTLLPEQAPGQVRGGLAGRARAAAHRPGEAAIAAGSAAVRAWSWLAARVPALAGQLAVATNQAVRGLAEDVRLACQPGGADF
eukprot:7622112-Alexandrium_andersonii.AAC.1